MRGAAAEPGGRANVEGDGERRGFDLDTARPGNLNDGTEGLPRAVFYANDGALLYREEAEIEPLLELVGRWCKRNGIEVNAAKCGHVTLRPDPGPVCWGTELIPQVQEYRYLGFPVTAKGIDFQDHLGRRLEQAKANARFMAQHSATRVWRTVGVGGHSARQAAVDANGCRMAPLIQWIAGGEAGWRVSQNLLGILNLCDRFECRHAAFLRDLHCQARRLRERRTLAFAPVQGDSMGHPANEGDKICR
ncbi:hypothetical protein KC319_g39 [Hortaea werneckii]|nr:hypothetical protein KC319_g39 [Hortaea werneckii]